MSLIQADNLIARSHPISRGSSPQAELRNYLCPELNQEPKYLTPGEFLDTCNKHGLRFRSMVNCVKPDYFIYGQIFCIPMYPKLTLMNEIFCGSCFPLIHILTNGFYAVTYEYCVLKIKIQKDLKTSSRSFVCIPQLKQIILSLYFTARILNRTLNALYKHKFWLQTGIIRALLF